MGLECVIISCGHGNHGNSAVSCAKFDAHKHCHCQVIRVACIRGGYARVYFLYHKVRTVVLCVQVNEKSCRLRMAAYKDGARMCNYFLWPWKPW